MAADKGYVHQPECIERPVSWLGSIRLLVPGPDLRLRPPPQAPERLGTQPAPLRVAETVRYSAATAVHAVAPDGLLAWLAVTGLRLGAVLGVGWALSSVLLQVVVLLAQIAIGCVVIAVCLRVLMELGERRQ